MRNNIKIAIGGKMRSGKDVAASYIIKFFQDRGYEAFNFKFSEGIKNIYNEYSYKPSLSKPRKEYQEIGQEIRRILGEDVWVNYTLKGIEEALMRYPKCCIVVSDVRQDNEIKKLKKEGFILIYLNSDIKNIKNRMKCLGEEVKDSELNHETEDIDKSKFDIFIDNNGSLDKLRSELNYLCVKMIRN